MSDLTGILCHVTSEEELVFESVRARVESGDYLDERLGPPGIDTEGGGAFQYAPDGRLQRMYWRGTPEYSEAHAAGLLELLPPLTPASEDEVKEFEAHLGRPLPSLLRRCYLELGDGGFGPAYGLEPLRPILRVLREEHPGWPEAWHPMAKVLLPTCNWGCGITSYVDVSDPANRMWAIDPNPAPQDDFEVSLFPQHFGLTEWLRRWIDGTLHQPWLLQDPKTGDWRGATDAETGAVLEEQY
ncbi:SMI1/KNR4 family protein [Actinomadura harenae]|uniref:SMI1/KNR4 family protein n=1 Tax=Actinomadura harenae TaxID=2483351 RepID=A0A3M2M8X5_9ACTN|nr:SMI1/KNR4 family protein [Actinomadura harenae]RMI45323.1 SMI1/KNR4 family protein [Actinomadura harenae]